MSNNQNFVQAQGEIGQQASVAPVNTGGRQKRDDIQNLPAGLNAGVLYAIIDLGTHEWEYKGNKSMKRLIYIGFEHPQLQQLFYVDDTEKRSTSSRKECSFVISDNSFLYQLITTIKGPMTVAQAKNVPLISLLGATVAVHIENKPGTKDPNKIYDKVKGVMAANNLQMPPNFNPTTPQQFFIIDTDPSGKVIGNHFLTSNFGKLPEYFRERILSSFEGKTHALNGGKFADKIKEDNTSGKQSSAPQQQAIPQAPLGANEVKLPDGRVLTWLSKEYTLEQLSGNGWSIPDMINSGYAKLKTNTPPPPAPKAVPPAPQQSNIPQPPSQTQGQSVQQVSQAPVQQGGSNDVIEGEDDDDLPF